MKLFLKILLVAALLFVAIKLSPLIFVMTLGALLAATVLGAAGLSLLAVFLVVLMVLAAALAPIWLPILVIMGLISLFRKNGDHTRYPGQAA